MLRSSRPAIFITATAQTCPKRNAVKAKNCMANRPHDILSKEKIGCCSKWCKMVQNDLLYKIEQVASIRVKVIEISDCIHVIALQPGIENRSCGTRTGDHETDGIWLHPWVYCANASHPFLHRGSALRSHLQRSCWKAVKKADEISHFPMTMSIKFAYFTPISRTNHEAIYESIYPPIA